MALRVFTRMQVSQAELRDRLIEEHGATAVEYALMLAFIFMVVIGAVAFLGRETSSQYEKVRFP